MLNINIALGHTYEVRFSESSATGFAGWFSKWLLPSCELPYKLDLSRASVMCHQDVKMYMRARHKQYYQWAGSISAPKENASACGWDHWPFVLGYQTRLSYPSRGENTDNPRILHVWSFKDQDQFPLVILIDRKGLVVPSVRVKVHTPVRIVFLNQGLNKFQFGLSGALLGLQFVEGKSGVTTDAAQRYRDRLERFIQKGEDA